MSNFCNHNTDTIFEMMLSLKDTIAFASCITKGNPIGYPCPFAAKMKELVQKEVGDAVKILDFTH